MTNNDIQLWGNMYRGLDDILYTGGVVGRINKDICGVYKKRINLMNNTCITKLFLCLMKL